MIRCSIGYVLVPGFRTADVVGVQSILGAHPLDKSLFLAESLAPVSSNTNVTLVPTATFDQAPQLDVLVIGDVPDAALDDDRLINFLKRALASAKNVIGISRGVEALARTGLLSGVRVTTDKRNLHRLEEFGVTTSAAYRPVGDGKFVTAGPSTGMLEAAYLVLEQLRGKAFTKYIELNLEYDPVVQFQDTPTEADPDSQVAHTRSLKVAAIMPSTTYAPDVIGALDVFGLLPGTEIVVVSDSTTPSRCAMGPKVVPTCTYEECPEVDVVVIGLVGPQYLADERLLRFIRRQDKHASAMISVCAGSLVFGAAGILKNKKATSNFHHTALLRKFGATPSTRPVERDGRYFSAGPAIGSYEIALQVVAELYGACRARELEQKMLQFAPSPVYGVGSPEKASRLLRWVSKTALLPSLPLYLMAGKVGNHRFMRNGGGVQSQLT